MATKTDVEMAAGDTGTRRQGIAHVCWSGWPIAGSRLKILLDARRADRSGPVFEREGFQFVGTRNRRCAHPDLYLDHGRTEEDPRQFPLSILPAIAGTHPIST